MELHKWTPASQALLLQVFEALWMLVVRARARARQRYALAGRFARRMAHLDRQMSGKSSARSLPGKPGAADLKATASATDPYKPGFQVSRFPGFQVSRFPGSQVSRFPGFRVSRFPGSQMPRFLGFQVFRFPSFQASRLPGSQVSRFPGSPVPLPY